MAPGGLHATALLKSGSLALSFTSECGACMTRRCGYIMLNLATLDSLENSKVKCLRECPNGFCLESCLQAQHDQVAFMHAVKDSVQRWRDSRKEKKETQREEREWEQSQRRLAEEKARRNWLKEREEKVKKKKRGRRRAGERCSLPGRGVREISAAIY